MTSAQEYGNGPHWSIGKSKQGLVFTFEMKDYFTKWPEAIPLKDMTTKSVAGVLLLVNLMWGPLVEEFIVELNCKLSRQQGIKRQYATVYYPQTNGQVVWFNKTLKAMIAKFVNSRHDNLGVFLPAFLYA